MAVDFDPFSRDFFDDPYTTYAKLREEAPLFHSEKWDFYAFSLFDDIVDAHRDTATFSSAYGLTYEQLSKPGKDGSRSIIMMDPPEHTRYRKLVSRSFTPRSIGSYEDMVRGLVSEYLDPLMDEDEFDFVDAFAGPFPVEVIAAILGVPKADRQQIRHWTDTMLRREEGEATGGDAQAVAAIEQVVYFMELVAEKRENPTDDMLSELTQMEVETEAGDTVKLDDDEIAGFGTLLGAAGSETVTKLLGNAVVLFDRNRDEYQKIKDRPEVIPNAVEEILRYWAPSQYQGRFSVKDSTWHGVELPAGKPVFLLTGAANHDPSAYDDPDRFDVDRVPKLSIGFGHGLHVCLGAAMARLESIVAIDEIRKRWPTFSIDESACERVQMSNVAGYSKVPMAVG